MEMHKLKPLLPVVKEHDIVFLLMLELQFENLQFASIVFYSDL